MKGIIRIASLLLLPLICASVSASFAADSPATDAPKAAAPIELVLDSYIPDWSANPTTRCVNRFFMENPNIAVRPFSSLKLPGALGAGESAKLMAFAGGIAPDVVQCWFHQLESYQRQGFLYDLSEFIGQDRDGDGYISDEESHWERWKLIPPSYRRALTIDGKPYAAPFRDTLICLAYRRDLVSEITGSQEPPRTWDEFFTICQKLTRAATKLPNGKLKKGRAGFYADPAAFKWLAWLWSAGGEEIMQGRTSPTDGKTYWFAKEVFAPRSPSGEDLSRVKPVWRCTFASPEGQAAVGFYHKLFWQPWIRDPKTGEPINLTEEQAKTRRVTASDGRVIEFAEADLFRGVSRGMIGDDKEGADMLFKRGEVCFAFGPNVVGIAQEISANQIGLMAAPSPDGKRMSAMKQPTFFCLNSALAKASPEKRQAAWKLLVSLTGDNYDRESYQLLADMGLLRLADPKVLRRIGMEEYLADIPEHWLRQLEEIDRDTHTEPFIGYWQGVSDMLGQQILGRIIADPKFDYKTALQMIEDQANNKVMRGRDEAELRRIRPYAWAIFAGVCALMCWVLAAMWKGLKESYLKAQTTADAGAAAVHKIQWYTRYMPWLMLAPALLLVAMWTYYPIAQGTVMAFQDYKILAAKPFVGLDNFITVFLDPKFYKFLWITCKFVVVNIALGFTAPIVLGIMLNEIPWGKLGLRMLYLLPQVTSGLVIAFIWQMMYYPTEVGFFNAILMKLGLITKPLQFLFDPNMALVWVTVPSVWAGVGAGSLIYLAALKTIPDDLYEAAEIDGAGLWAKLARVTLPTLLPIILINFLGSFIGLFHSMGNIFLMTGGGPGDETTVLSLAIWRDSFLLLKFGTATATAWTLAAMLVAFTVVQLRVLSRVEFRRAEE